METLQIIWFILIVVLLVGYAILDGFDLGVGVIHLFTKGEIERRKNLNAIGPIWDGNEVWLLTGGGALFAAFPIVYATVFSSFYLALMLLLVALIFRAVAIEFRSKVDSVSWKHFWDYAFGIGSLLPAILFGVAYGNILRGIPIEQNNLFTGNFFTLLNPFSIFVGVFSLITFVMHGATYLLMKVENNQKEFLIKIIPKLWITFIILYLIITFFSIFEAKHLFQSVLKNPLTYLFFLIFITSLVTLPIFLKAHAYGKTFLCTTGLIFSLFILSAISMFPNLVISSIDPIYNLTIFNSSSTQNTLTTMLIIALIGMPIVIAYTIIIYRIFKGKVVLTEDSY